MNQTLATQDEVKTFRGGSIEEVLPRIRAELGPEAVILRQREGLVGGVGGFFQRRCIEVEARAGGPRVDVYDEEVQDDAPLPEVADSLVRNDAATREGLATPAVRELVGQAEPFAQMLADLGPADVSEPEAVAEAEIEVPARAERLTEGMVGAGLDEAIARDVVAAVLVSAMPFATAARLRTLVRNELAGRMAVAPLAGPGERTIVVVGPAGSGAGAALEAIGAAHAAAGTPVVRGDVIRPPHRDDRPEGCLLLLDSPPLWSGADRLPEVAAAIGKLEAAEVHLALRAGTAAAAAAELLEGLTALQPNRLLLTGAGASSHLGGVLGLAIERGLPLGYVAEGEAEIAPADPRALASRIVP
jgi:flagellar biosynthesis GTPase FlhF